MDQLCNIAICTKATPTVHPRMAYTARFMFPQMRHMKSVTTHNECWVRKSVCSKLTQRKLARTYLNTPSSRLQRVTTQRRAVSATEHAQVINTCAIINAGRVPHGFFQVHGHFWCSTGQMFGDHCCHQIFCFLEDTKDSPR